MDPRTGGVCQAARTIISGLSAFGIDSEVVTLDPIDASSMAEDLFQIHRIGQGISPWSYNPKLIPWLVSNLPRFDTVILHGIWLYHSYAVEKAVRIVRKQVLKQFLESNAEARPVYKLLFFVMPQGMLDPYFQRAKSRKFKAIRNLVYWRMFESNVINNADAILFTCEAERHLAREPFRPYHPKKEIVVGLGVEEPPQYEEQMAKCFFEKCPQAAHVRYLLFLSRIDEKKGVDLLINAYSALLESSTLHRDLKLVIAGPGLGSAYGKIIKHLVVGNPLLKDRVLFPGMLSGNAKWGAFYGCEAFVLPSHQENFGIAVVEALACGKAVLISNQINIWKDIEESGGGIIAKDTKDGTETNLIYWLGLSEAAKKEVGKKAHLCFKKKFTKDQAAERLFRVIKGYIE